MAILIEYNINHYCTYWTVYRSNKSHYPADINECTTKTPPCEQNCANKEGGFECSCSDGFIPSPLDPNQCDGKDRTFVFLTPLDQSLGLTRRSEKISLSSLWYCVHSNRKWLAGLLTVIVDLIVQTGFVILNVMVVYHIALCTYRTI